MDKEEHLWSLEHKGFDRDLFTKNMENAGLVAIECVTAFVIDGAIRDSKQDYPGNQYNPGYPI